MYINPWISKRYACNNDMKLFTGTRCLGSMGSTTTDGKNHVLPIDSGTPTEPKRRIPVNYALRILFASFKNLQICFVLNRSLGSRISLIRSSSVLVLWNNVL